MGSYAITQGSLAAPNYAITFVPGVLTIVTAPVAVPVPVAAPSEPREFIASALAKDRSLVAPAVPLVVSLQEGAGDDGTAGSVNLRVGRQFNSVFVCISEASNCSASP